MFFVGVLWGNVNSAPPVYADVYMTAEDSIWQTSGNDICYINFTSKYYIEVSAQQSSIPSGRLMAYVQLKQGDILTSQVLAGGSAGNNRTYGDNEYHSPRASKGGDAYIIYLNGTPLIGAGGTGGKSYWATGQGTSGDYYIDPNAYGTTAYDNSHFSSGAGGWHYHGRGGRSGSTWYGTYGYGGAGNTIAGCTPANNTTSPVGNGSNYLDTSRATLISAPNNGTAVSVTLRPVIVTEKQSLSSISDGIERMSSTLSTLTNKVGSSSNGAGSMAFTPTDDIPMVSVTVNTNFDITLSVYDDMQSGQTSDGKVKVVNSSIGDHYVHIQGKLTEVGLYQANINSHLFNIKVIENPNSTNVIVKLE